MCVVLAGLDPDMTTEDVEEKARLISQVMELQNTLDGENGLLTKADLH